MEGLPRSQDGCWRPSECHHDRQEGIFQGCPGLRPGDAVMVHLECQLTKFPLGDTAMSVRLFQRDGTEEERPTLDVGSAIPQAVVTHQIKMKREGCTLSTNVQICFFTAGAGWPPTVD